MDINLKNQYEKWVNIKPVFKATQIFRNLEIKGGRKCRVDCRPYRNCPKAPT